MKRYAGKLLYQFRVVRHGRENRRRLCEERIVITVARSAATALKKLRSRGRSEQTDYVDGDAQVFVEFIGVREMIELGASLDSEEVWWEFATMVRPMECRRRLIPRDEDLRAFTVGSERAKRRRKSSSRRSLK